MAKNMTRFLRYENFWDFLFTLALRKCDGQTGWSWDMVSHSGYRLRLYVRRLSLIMHTLQVAILTPEGGSWGYPYIQISPYTDNPTSPGKVGHTGGVYVPALFEQWCGFFYVPQEPDKWKCYETGPTGFRPYPRRLETCRTFNRL